jgi:hypothetical protein
MENDQRVPFPCLEDLQSWSTFELDPVWTYVEIRLVQ